MDTPVKSPATNEGKISRDTLVLAGAVLLGALIVAGAVATTKQVERAATVPTGTETPPPTEETAGSTTIDDDPVLGDKTRAKVAIVEFSDYECPFCQRFHKETYDSLVKEYVESGQALYVFRDFPLSFHEPNATLEAGIAECVGQAKGDAAYFAINKAIFANTASNGQGMPAASMDELIRNTGADPKAIRTCAATQAVKDEIAKDMADGQAAGVSGTPSFIIGKIEADGKVTGEKVVGAMPLSGFKTALDKYLAE